MSVKSLHKLLKAKKRAKKLKKKMNILHNNVPQSQKLYFETKGHIRSIKLKKKKKSTA